MEASKHCPRCGVEVSDSCNRCVRCGAALDVGLRITLLAGIVLLLMVAGSLLWKFVFSGARHGASKKTGSFIAATIEPSPAQPALDIPNALQMNYEDLGPTVQIVLTAKGMPILYVDLKENGKVDADGNDLSFAVNPDGSICVQRLSVPEGSECNVTSSAKAKIEGGPGVWKITWNIPKKELSTEGHSAHIAFQVFDEKTQHGTYYPQPPFAQVYDLRFVESPVSVASGSSVSIPITKDTPPPVVEDSRSLPLEKNGQSNPSSNSSLRPRSENNQHQVAIENFQADPATVERGSGTVLRWKVAGAKRVRIVPAIDAAPLPIQGERTIFPDRSGDYTLIVEGLGGTQSKRISVAVTSPAAPLIVSFRAEPAAIDKGKTTLLHWKATGATAVRIAPGWNSLPTQGEVEATPDQTTEYTLTAEGPGGWASNHVTVLVAAPARPLVSFDADPPAIAQGRSAMLRWSVSGASQVSIDPDLGPQSSQGSAMVRPFHTMRYTLSAVGPGGTSTKELIISVNQSGPSTGQIVWRGNVNGIQLITIDRNHSDVGVLEGSLPGVPCIIQPVNEKLVGVASAPSPRNNYERLVLRVIGHGPTTVVIKWSLQ